MIKKLKNINFASCVDRVVILMVNKKKELLPYFKISEKIVVYSIMLFACIFIFYKIIFSADILEKRMFISIAIVLTVFASIIALVVAYNVSKKGLLQSQKLNLDDDFLIKENSPKESDTLNVTKDSFFADDLISKIHRTILTLNISTKRTCLAILYIYIHKINVNYKGNYNYSSNNEFVENVDDILKTTKFTPGHYGKVMNNLCLFYYDDTRSKIVKEININSMYYRRFLEIKEAFDNVFIADSNKIK